MTMHPLVALLETRRQEAGLTKRGLSERAGYGRDYWWRAVNGYHTPSLAAFCDHAQALGFSFRLMRDA